MTELWITAVGNRWEPLPAALPGFGNHRSDTFADQPGTTREPPEPLTRGERCVRSPGPDPRLGGGCHPEPSTPSQVVEMSESSDETQTPSKPPKPSTPGAAMTTLAAIATATLIITAFAAVVAAVLTDRHEHRTDYEQFARDLDDAAERRRLRRLFETDQLPGGPTRDDVA